MRATLALLFMFSLAVAGPAAAQTADGLPPSVETTCLNAPDCAFGLCNAFCEANDCHCLEYPDACIGQPIPEQSNKCPVLRENYIEATGQEPPCLQAARCPCLDDDNWASQRNTWFQFISGGILPTNCDEVEGELALSVIINDGFWAASIDNTAGSGGDGEEPEYFCRILQPDLGPEGDTLSLTLDQAADCYNLFVTAAAAGSVCADLGV